MQINTLNAAQMMILESFASVKDNQEMEGLMDVLQSFYVNRLEKELERLWNDGTLDKKALARLRQEHLRTPYRK